MKAEGGNVSGGQAREGATRGAADLRLLLRRMEAGGGCGRFSLSAAGAAAAAAEEDNGGCWLLRLAAAAALSMLCSAMCVRSARGEYRRADGSAVGCGAQARAPGGQVRAGLENERARKRKRRKMGSEQASIHLNFRGGQMREDGRTREKFESNHGRR